MVNRSTAAPGAKLNQNQTLGVSSKWKDYSPAEFVFQASLHVTTTPVYTQTKQVYLQNLANSAYHDAAVTYTQYISKCTVTL